MLSSDIIYEFATIFLYCKILHISFVYNKLNSKIKKIKYKMSENKPSRAYAQAFWKAGTHVLKKKRNAKSSKTSTFQKLKGVRKKVWKIHCNTVLVLCCRNAICIVFKEAYRKLAETFFQLEVDFVEMIDMLWYFCYVFAFSKFWNEEKTFQRFFLIRLCTNL